MARSEPDVIALSKASGESTAQRAEALIA